MNKYIIYGSLWNFDLDNKADELKIGDFTLKRINRVNVNPIGQRLGTLGLDLQDSNFLSTLLFLYQARPNRDFPHFVVQTKISFVDEFNFQEADRLIKFFITALRLYKDGNFQGRFISGIQENDFKGEMTPIDADSYPHLESKYILDNPKKFEKFLSDISDMKELIDSIPVDRFNISYSRYSSPIDRLIDLIISLEGLFNKSSFDVKYKVAIRASHALYPERSDDKHTTYMNIIKAYNLRNDIVHGKKVAQPEELNTINTTLEGIVKKILLESIDKSFRKKIDLYKRGLDDEELDKVLLNS